MCNPGTINHIFSQCMKRLTALITLWATNNLASNCVSNLVAQTMLRYSRSVFQPTSKENYRGHRNAECLIFRVPFWSPEYQTFHVFASPVMFSGGSSERHWTLQKRYRGRQNTECLIFQVTFWSPEYQPFRVFASPVVFFGGSSERHWTLQKNTTGETKTRNV